MATDCTLPTMQLTHVPLVMPQLQTQPGLLPQTSPPKPKKRKKKPPQENQNVGNRPEDLAPMGNNHRPDEDSSSERGERQTSGEDWQNLVDYHKSLLDVPGQRPHVAPPVMAQPVMAQPVSNALIVPEIPIMSREQPQQPQPPQQQPQHPQQQPLQQPQQPPQPQQSPTGSTSNTHLCRICNKAFHQWHHLKRHLLSHTDFRPFACTVCGKRFQIQNKLKRHEGIHSGLKPYQCTMCDVKVSRMEHLRRHLLTHSEAKPYRCSQCDHTARRADSIRTHIRKTHKEGATVLRVDVSGQIGVQGSVKPILMQPREPGEIDSTQDKPKKKKKKKKKPSIEVGVQAGGGEINSPLAPMKADVPGPGAAPASTPSQQPPGGEDLSVGGNRHNESVFPEFDAFMDRMDMNKAVQQHAAAVKAASAANMDSAAQSFSAASSTMHTTPAVNSSVNTTMVSHGAASNPGRSLAIPSRADAAESVYSQSGRTWHQAGPTHMMMAPQDTYPISAMFMNQFGRSQLAAAAPQGLPSGGMLPPRALQSADRQIPPATQSQLMWHGRPYF